MNIPDSVIVISLLLNIAFFIVTTADMIMARKRKEVFAAYVHHIAQQIEKEKGNVE